MAGVPVSDASPIASSPNVGSEAKIRWTTGLGSEAPAMAGAAAGRSAMMLELTSEEAELVRQLLSQAVRDLGPEIHHTSSRQYRNELENRRERLERLLARLGEDAITASS